MLQINQNRSCMKFTRRNLVEVNISKMNIMKIPIVKRRAIEINMVFFRNILPKKIAHLVPTLTNLNVNNLLHFLNNRRLEYLNWLNCIPMITTQ
mmetsp:Transcript_12359/g.17104  ORF Transcript_12359/g.17104 Transcript_12359/m.17104 type:complete len:94 (+) Transcript_12359:1163-1444(+)